MTDIFELTVEPRTVLGKGASRRLRRSEDKVPGIVYGGDQAPLNITIQHRHVKKALENEAFYSHILTLNEGKKKHKVVLKDIQRHPYKPQVLHMDFLRVSADTAITMHVPLHFLGEDTAPGVKAGGIVTHHMVELEIRCLPKDLPEFIEVDLTEADLDAIIHLKEIQVPKGVEIMSLVHSPDNDQPVASIHRPKRAVEEEPSAEVDTAADTESKSSDKDASSK